ncbi:MAG: preprotein translocase subunit SecG [Rhodothermaceae bacterium TMED105]|nr:MAG: preprotein translocase subunit SecG [Rhodothermaceae bacterium TMED105]|tara:strand:+ start:2993 stop:3403 length:411 start_codon:yes stop_codon:yes gene_type:complete
MLYGIILGVIVLVCVLLIIVVLLQPGQKQGLSGGLAAGMTGGGGMGARRTADLLSKSTTVLASVFLGLCVLANFAIDRGGQATQSAVQSSGVPVTQGTGSQALPMPAQENTSSVATEETSTSGGDVQQVTPPNQDN